MKNLEDSAAPVMLGEGRHSIRDFVFTAVHDLREPLRAIRTGSERLAALQTDPGEDAARCFRFIREGVDRMELLIRDLSEYCYLETRDLNMGEVELGDALREAEKELSDQFRIKRAELTHGPLPTVCGDFAALTAVFRSLLDNACKFQSSAPPRIHAGAVLHGAEVAVFVRDNGLGMDPAYHTRIFMPFEKLNGKRFPGSGLGLTLANKIVQRHGGRMWAESQPGAGSTFWFSLRAS